MNGIHDMGGMEGFGPVVREENEPVFHADWEKRMFALANVVLGQTGGNVDEFRHAIERVPAPRYLGTSYYEKWLDAAQTLLIEKGIVTREELAARGAQPPAPVQGPGRGPAASARKRARARFRAGDRVRARNLNPHGHTRLPRYVRGKRGVIRSDWGVYVYADSNAHGAGQNPQHVYCVEFAARELWGPDAPARDVVRIDLWEDYLEPDAAARTARKPPTRARAASKRGAKRRKR
jgi:nitrile hydratase beta subunit